MPLPTKLKREFLIRPTDDGQSAQFVWTVSGPDLVVQFVLSFHDHKRGEHLTDTYAMAWDLGYHCSFQPHEYSFGNECDLLPGGRCWYDGSSLNAKELFEKVRREGTDTLWQELEDYYESCWDSFASERLAGR